MPALCSALRRRSPLRFPGTLFRASPVPSFVLHPCSPPRYACTFPHTRLELSPPTTRALSAAWRRRCPPRYSHAFPRTSPRYANALPHAPPGLYFLLCRRYALSFALPWRSFGAGPAIFFALLRRNFFASLLRSFVQRRDSSHCTGAIFLAAPAISFVLRQPYRFCIAGEIFGTAPVHSLARCRRPLLPCAGGILRAAPPVSFSLRRRYRFFIPGALFCPAPAVFFALRRRSLSCSTGAIVCGPPGLSLPLRPYSLSSLASAILRSSLVLSFAVCRRSSPRTIGAVPGAKLSPRYLSGQCPR